MDSRPRGNDSLKFAGSNGLSVTPLLPGDAGAAVAAPALQASGYSDGFARAQLPPPAQWPALQFDLPALQYPARLNCVAALLDAAVAAGAGPRWALHAAGGSWTYAHLQDRVNRIARVLRHDLGLASGSRVLLRGANSPMMAACLLAVMKAGCIAVPSMPQLRAGELAAMLAKAQVNAVLCSDSLLAELAGLAQLPVTLRFDADRDANVDTGADADAATDAGAAAAPTLAARLAGHDGEFTAVDTAADDICLISFTSGTTGVPKATLHVHRDLLAICDCFPRSMLDTRADDVFVGTPPLAFTFGLGGLLLFPLRVGASAVLLEKPTAETLMAAIARYRASIIFTVPTMYRQLAPLCAGHDVSSLRSSVSAGEALPLATRDAWQAASGLAMIDGIGATELLHIFIAAAGAQIRRGATGKPIPGYQACILDAAGKPVGPGVIGRLAVKGPTGCRYLDDARQAEYVIDGWNLTGDAYEMDADGYFYYRARSDDMIISAGYNIAGPEVEEALLRHPAVLECAVVGRPDAARGQVVEANLVLRPGYVGSAALALALQEFVKRDIAPYKYPRVVKFIERLPRTDTGKLQRYKLRAA